MSQCSTLLMHMQVPLNTDALPSAIQVNEPVRLPGSSHILELIATLYLFASIGGGVYMLMTLNEDSDIGYVPYIILAQGYIVYLSMATCCNKTRKYLSMVKSLAQYESVYYKFIREPGFFNFHVTCYHYETRITYVSVRDQNGNTRQQMRTHQQKVVTHSASETLLPRDSTDISGHIDDLIENKEIIFMRYDKHYVFGDPKSQGVFQATFSDFKFRHNRDEYQDASFEFVIPGFVDRLAYYKGDKISSGWFYLWTFLGFVYPYVMCLEVKVARYAVPITKQITF